MLKNAHKIGAVFYILWGVFHSYVGILLLQKVFSQGTYGALSTIGSALPSDQIPQVNSPVMNGVIEHYAWNLVWFGIYAIVLAIFMNWKNSKTGYWFNLVVVSLTDIGFIAAIILPGYISVAEGWPGPIFWILAFVFTTIGLRNARASQPQIA